MHAEHHYRNLYLTFNELLDLGIVPVVNENDTLATNEFSVGDNDTLSALVASLMHADNLVLLTDVEALYTADPSKDPSAKPIRRVDSIDDLKADIGGSGKWGTGGMVTKIQAARIGS
jgi:glutamate 5-kinase